MIRIILISLCVINFGASACIAQTNGPQTIANWGEGVQDVQMAITMTNNVVEPGSEIPLLTVIKNSSTNVITVQEIDMPGDFYVALTGSAGERYDLIQLPIIVRSVSFRPINPGEQEVRTLPVTFGKNIKPGDYTLQATRWFWVESRAYQFKLVSNSLKVRIK